MCRARVQCTATEGHQGTLQPLPISIREYTGGGGGVRAPRRTATMPWRLVSDIGWCAKSFAVALNSTPTCFAIHCCSLESMYAGHTSMSTVKASSSHGSAESGGRDNQPAARVGVETGLWGGGGESKAAAPAVGRRVPGLGCAGGFVGGLAVDEDEEDEDAGGVAERSSFAERQHCALPTAPFPLHRPTLMLSWMIPCSELAPFEHQRTVAEI